MPIRIESLSKGDVLYDVHTRRAGNTTIRVEGCWEVYVRDVGTDERGPWALMSWNGNPPKKQRGTTKYRRHPKEWLRQDIWGPRSCYCCQANEDDGHREHCDHPRAVSKRRRAAKALASLRKKIDGSQHT